MTRPDFIRSQLSEAEVDDLRVALTASEAARETAERQLAEAVEARRLFYAIEMAGSQHVQPHWWAGNSIGWTVNIHDAIQFPRRQDAERAIEGQSGMPGKVSEHIALASTRLAGDAPTPSEEKADV